MFYVIFTVSCYKDGGKGGKQCHYCLNDHINKYLHCDHVISEQAPPHPLSPNCWCSYFLFEKLVLLNISNTDISKYFLWSVIVIIYQYSTPSIACLAINYVHNSFLSRKVKPFWTVLLISFIFVNYTLLLAFVRQGFHFK